MCPIKFILKAILCHTFSGQKKKKKKKTRISYPSRHHDMAVWLPSPLASLPPFPKHLGSEMCLGVSPFSLIQFASSLWASFPFRCLDINHSREGLHRNYPSRPAGGAVTAAARLPAPDSPKRRPRPLAACFLPIGPAQPRLTNGGALGRLHLCTAGVQRRGRLRRGGQSVPPRRSVLRGLVCRRPGPPCLSSRPGRSSAARPRSSISPTP